METLNKQSKNNITSTPLSDGSTFTGTWEDCSSFGHIVVSIKADSDTTYYVDFSSDGSTTSYTETYSVLKNVHSTQKIATVRSKFRIRVTNSSGMNQSSLSLDVLLKDGGLVLDRVISIGQGGIPSINVITRTANSAPTDLALSTLSIPDVTAVDEAVATISVTDANSPNDSFTYILQEDLNNKFYITGNTLYLADTVTSPNTYDITIRVIDQGGKHFDKDFTITATSFSNDYSITLDGSTDILSNTVAAFPLDGSFTISIWVKYTSVGGLGYLSVVGSLATNTPRLLTSINYATNKVTATLYGASSNSKSKTTALLCTNGAWNHIAVTWKVGGVFADLKVYINGVESTYESLTDNTLAAMTPLTNGFTIGKIPSSFTFAYNGKVDEHSMWSAELSAAQITELYNSGQPTDLLTHSAVANLWAWHRMGDSDPLDTDVIDDLGTTARDLTGTSIVPATNYTTDVP